MAKLIEQLTYFKLTFPQYSSEITLSPQFWKKANDAYIYIKDEDMQEDMLGTSFIQMAAEIKILSPQQFSLLKYNSKDCNHANSRLTEYGNTMYLVNDDEFYTCLETIRALTILSTSNIILTPTEIEFEFSRKFGSNLPHPPERRNF